ncbi:sensor histidine kinase [Leptospira perolatii]|uniref:sensor histidine kinase n=1 Tax=Leptospira perolatii TaxID=2023191 RepID=UPI0013FDE548|nr:histidine kinase [Leptospira perolatii]
MSVQFSLRFLPIGVFLFSILLLMVFSILRNSPNKHFTSSLPVIEILDGWQYRWGDSPIDTEGVPIWTKENSDKEWTSFVWAQQPPNRNGAKDLWLRTRLPEGYTHDVSIYFAGSNMSYEVYLESTVLFKTSDFLALKNNANALFGFWEVISLPKNPAGKIVYFKIHSENPSFIGIIDTVKFGYKGDILLELVQKDLVKAIVSASLILACPFFLFWFWNNKREYYFLHIGLFCLSAGVGILSGTHVREMFFNNPLFWINFGNTAFFLSIYFYLSFSDSILTKQNKFLLVLLQLLLLGFAYLSMTLNKVSLLYIENTLDEKVVYWSQILFGWLFYAAMLATVLFVLRGSILTYRKGMKEAGLYFFGNLGFASFISIQMADYSYSHPMFFNTNFHWGILFIAILMAYMMERKFTRTRQKISQLKQEWVETDRALKEANLISLQNTMNPHFLFNSLNTIHSLVHLNTQLADKAILLLSDIYRYLVDYGSSPLVPFSKEWKFMEEYLELQRIRFSDKLMIETQSENLEIQIPPISLQPIVENSIKHGFAGKKGDLKILIKAYKVDNTVSLLFEDNGVGLASESNGALFSRSLGNISKRFKYHFPGAKLQVSNLPEQGVSVLISFKIPEERSHE